jgi:hypothetical protein
MELEHCGLRSEWVDLVLRVQRELDAVAIGAIVRDAVPYKGELRFDIELPANLGAEQRREIRRLVDNAEVASRFL